MPDPEPERRTPWTLKRDELRRRLAAVRPNLEYEGKLRAAPGEVVAPDGVEAMVTARGTFLRIAGAVAPRLLVELSGAPLDEYAAHWDALGGPAAADGIPGPALERQLLREFVVMVLEEETETGEWIGAWGFPASADWESALRADDGLETLLRRAAVSGWGLTMAAYTLHCWRSHPLPAEGPPGLVDAFAAGRRVEDGDLGLETPLVLPTPRWDPQREEQGKATERIHGELHAAVRGELDRIAERARGVGARRPKVTELMHFAWLARYQFLRESYATIATSAGRQRQSVTPAVQAVAELVGMPLRRSGPPGRPRKILAAPVPPRRRPAPRETVTPLRAPGRWEPGDGRLPPPSIAVFDRLERAEQ